MPQIENPDDLQLIANLIRVFCICMTIACYDGNKKKESVGKLLEHGHCIWQSNWDEILAGLRANLQKRHFARNRWLGILIEQEMRSTVFDKKSLFSCIKIEKNVGQNQSTCDLLCSAFNLFQDENGTFLPASFLFAKQKHRCSLMA